MGLCGLDPGFLGLEQGYWRCDVKKCGVFEEEGFYGVCLV